MAAPAYADQANLTIPYTGAGGSAAFTTPCAVNDLIIAYVHLGNAGANVPPVLSDNVNSGPYNLIGTAYFDATATYLTAMYYKVCNAVGTPTVTVPSTVATLGGSSGGKMGALRWNGFVGVPTLDAASVTRNTGTINPVTSQALSTSVNPELMILMESGTGAFQKGPGSGSWSWANGATGSNLYQNPIASAAPTVVTFSDAATTPGPAWQVQTAGFYGVIPVTATEQVLLDDPARIGGSSQLFLGTVLDDTTGDTIHAGGADLKVWASDLNTMLATLFTPTQILGDANLTALVSDASKFIYQNATLTANRTIALPTSGLKDGMRWKVVRRAATPGAFTLTITGAAAPVVIASGTNGFAHFRAVSATAIVCEAQGTIP